MTDEIMHLACEVCGKSTPPVDAWATLAGGRIVYTCAFWACREAAKRIDEGSSDKACPAQDAQEGR